MKRHLKLTAALLALSAILVGCNDADTASKAPAGAGAGTERPPSPISVLIMKKAEQPLTTLLPGRAAAFQVAEIRPRVSGIIKEISFKEGNQVKEGALLYKIEDDTHRAQVAQAQASLAKAEASIPSAEANLARYERLVGSGATQIEFENAKVTLLQAKANVAEAKAALNAAQINLDLTEIHAPFEGVTSASKFSIGNVVTANQAETLTTLRRLDPIYIELTESSANLLRLKQAIAAGQLSNGDETADIKLTLEDGIEYPHVGKLDMSEMAVSETTGTYSIRAVFDNPDDLILPGMYVRASVTVGKENGYLIPQRAANRDARGALTAKFVNSDNAVETRTFTENTVSGNNWLVTEGISDGDKLIVDGFQWIGDGAPVAPVEATVDDNGFVVEAPKAPEATPAAKP